VMSVKTGNCGADCLAGEEVIRMAIPSAGTAETQRKPKERWLCQPFNILVNIIWLSMVVDYTVADQLAAKQEVYVTRLTIGILIFAIHFADYLTGPDEDWKL